MSDSAMLRPIVWAVAVAALAAAALAALDRATEARIAAHAEARATALMREIFPTAADFGALPPPAYSDHEIEILGLWRASNGGHIIKLVTPRGYSGDIELLVGIDPAGRVAGVRAVSHRETPGLGDAIEKRRSDWIDQFVGLSDHDPAAQSWRVRRFGGHFDAITSATITSSAVISAVHAAAVYSRQLASDNRR